MCRCMPKRDLVGWRTPNWDWPLSQATNEKNAVPGAGRQCRRQLLSSLLGEVGSRVTSEHRGERQEHS